MLEQRQRRLQQARRIEFETNARCRGGWPGLVVGCGCAVTAGEQQQHSERAFRHAQKADHFEARAKDR